MCVGSIGMLPSAALREWAGACGLYEPIHGSAPDIAGQGKANPCAAILSAAMLLRHSLDMHEPADRIDAAGAAAIARGARPPHLGGTRAPPALGESGLSGLALPKT